MASGEARITDRRSGLTIGFRLEGASRAPIEVDGGLAFFARGWASEEADVLHRVSEQGTEDFILLEKAPARPEVRYVIDVSAVAGLRLVSNTLEFLDHDGFPRLRAHRARLIESAGRAHEAHLAVAGCAVDTSAALPWDRRVVPPGAPACTVILTWPGEGVRYPAILDPRWATTDSMAFPRTHHTATQINPTSPTSVVLIAGGLDDGGQNQSPQPVAAAEVYDPVARTFAVTGSLKEPRVDHAATAVEITDGSGWRVLISGGRTAATDPPGLLGTTTHIELFRRSQGKFYHQIEAPASARYIHTATRFDVSKVLIAGGADGTGAPLKSTYVFELSNNPDMNGGIGTLTSSDQMTAQRAGHTAVVLSTEAAPKTASVLLAGGFVNITTAQKGTETFSASSSPMFESVGEMIVARAFHTATVVDDTHVLIAGGQLGQDPEQSAIWGNAEMYDVSLGSSPQLFTGGYQRTRHTGTLLPNGDILLAGGYGRSNGALQNSILSSTEVFCPEQAKLLEYGDLPAPRMFHAAVTTGTGSPNKLGRTVLITGGTEVQPVNPAINPEQGTDTAYLLLRGLGEPCAIDEQCESGECVTGVCCDGPCDAQCLACRADLKEESSVENSGTCGPAKDGTPTNITCVGGTKSFNGCDGKGSSVPKVVVNCAPFICNQEGDDCTKGCTSTTDCSSEGWCSLEPGLTSVPNGCPLNQGSSGAGGAGGSGGAGGMVSSGGSGGAGAGGSVGIGVGGSGGLGAGGPGGGGAGGSGIFPDPCIVDAGMDGRGPGGAGGIGGNGGGAAGSGGAGGGVASGVCACKRPNGATCEKDEECINDHCIDGFCCNTPCDSSCRSCAEPGFEGLCTRRGKPDHHEKPINTWSTAGGDPDGGAGGGGAGSAGMGGGGAGGGSPASGFRPACLGDDVCGGFCDGQSDDCQYPAEGLDCGLASCVDGVADSQSCQDHFCKSDESKSCFPYRCNNVIDADAGADGGNDADGGAVTPACNDRCDTDEDCDIDGFCDINTETCQPLTGPRCGANNMLRLPNKPDESCSPFQCRDVACLKSCKSHYDCASGFVCQLKGEVAGMCVPPPPPPDVPNCNCVAAGAASDQRFSIPWVLSLALIAAGRLIPRRRTC